jgi:hypothetical protein
MTMIGISDCVEPLLLGVLATRDKGASCDGLAVGSMFDLLVDGRRNNRPSICSSRSRIVESSVSSLIDHSLVS